MNQKRNKGITLIALVITIIVLLILAGVTISMVLGDDGIISQANAAKDAYERESANEDREIKNASFELDMITLEKNDPQAGNSPQAKSLQAKYGMLTGITPGTTVSELKKILPKGYEILDKNGNAIDKKDTSDVNEETTIKAGTGMQIVKDDIMVSRLVIYGDLIGAAGLTGDGKITSSDASYVNRGDAREDFQKVAADVDFNGLVNWEDAQIITNVGSGAVTDGLNQNISAQDSNKIIIESVADYCERFLKETGIKDNIIKSEYNEELRKILNICI